MRCAVLVALLMASLAHAHKSSDSYLRLSPSGASVHGRWDIALRDAALVVPLDANQNGEITWDELVTARPALERAAGAALTITQASAPCSVSFTTLRTVQHSDGAYAVLDFDAACRAPITTLTLTYTFLFDADANHRGLVRLDGDKSEAWLGFTAQQRTRSIAWKQTSAGEAFVEAVSQGVHHISIGWDHLCFLFALLLPSVVRRKGSAWEPVERLPEALREVLKVVTSFTVAHSVTLALAALGIANPDARLVEILIAASVALAALNNLTPFLPDGRWSLAFALGLLHGFGFVSALADLGATHVVGSLLGFNVGVELGQLVIVAAFVPLAFVARKAPAYRVVVLGGSAVIFVIALRWVVERW